MLKLIGWVLKASFFAVIILVSAHYITWDGKTVSDQVRSTLSSAERSAPVKTIRKTSRSLIEEAKETASHVGLKTAKKSDLGAKVGEASIPAEDRASLEAVIDTANSRQ